METVMEWFGGWKIIGAIGLTVSGLLTVFFMMIGRHNSNQEQQEPKQPERHEDIH